MDITLTAITIFSQLEPWSICEEGLINISLSSVYSYLILNPPTGHESL